MTSEYNHPSCLGFRKHLEHHGNGHFTQQYRTPQELEEFSQATRSFASTRGQEIEKVASSVIENPPNIPKEEFTNLSAGIKSVSALLTSGYLSVDVPPGKTMTHSSVLPFYLNALSSVRKPLESLCNIVDEHFSLNYKEMFEEFVNLGSSDNQIEIKRSQVKYFIDSILIISKLLEGGIGQNLGVFGKLVPNVQIHTMDPDNIQVTQFDGIFIPPHHQHGDLSSTLSRELLLRNLATKDPNYFDPEMYVARTPILELKTNFRPRWTHNRLSQHIPPYNLREITDRISRAYVEGGIAISPTVIVFVRLRSLGPNYVYHFYPNSSFFEAWERDILEGLDTFSGIRKSNYEAELLTEHLGKLLPFIDYEYAWHRQREIERLNNRKKRKPPEHVMQPRLQGIKVTKVEPTIKKMRPRSKKGRISSKEVQTEMF